jgi:hypothetical protein
VTTAIVAVEYTDRHGCRRVKNFECPYEARRFYVAKELVGKDPRVRKPIIRPLIEEVLEEPITKEQAMEVITCPDCGQLTLHFIENTEAGIDGEYKEVRTCERCQNIVYIVRHTWSAEELAAMQSERS